ncbi:hypothetical protein IPA_04555 [Ignicoccus pacificus DSM 13166]|uniref:Uncharacterized protein n=1 Tax=Ignicoccus pacificus DSM 13166 TaxID=940294 RepID=A0A977KB37_9CREN|nr:hypothetical protein IPA_04555 [Ignicoccus pacificus DSM 13166]
MNYATQFYSWIQGIVSHYLQIYVFAKNPELAARYGNLIVLMVTLTVIYALLEVFESFKKVLRYIILMGWFILVLAIVFNYLNRH